MSWTVWTGAMIKETMNYFNVHMACEYYIKNK